MLDGDWWMWGRGFWIESTNRSRAHRFFQIQIPTIQLPEDCRDKSGRLLCFAARYLVPLDLTSFAHHQALVRQLAKLLPCARSAQRDNESSIGRGIFLHFFKRMGRPPAPHHPSNKNAPTSPHISSCTSVNSCPESSSRSVTLEWVLANSTDTTTGTTASPSP